MLLRSKVKDTIPFFQLFKMNVTFNIYGSVYKRDARKINHNWLKNRKL